MARRNTNLSGAAGEHFVMFQLLRRGLVAGLAPRNAPDVDILVADRSGAHLSTVQVKMATHDVKIGWQMNVKHESVCVERLFYCFIDPGSATDQMPRSWIIPSGIVAEHVASTHRAWLGQGREKAIRRADGDRRKLHKVVSNPPLPQYPDGWIDQYREAWHLLGAQRT